MSQRKNERSASSLPTYFEQREVMQSSRNFGETEAKKEEEVLASAERLQNISTHEAGHIIVARHFGAEVHGIEYELNDSFGSARVALDMRELTTTQKATVLTAGMASEYMLLGAEHIDYDGLGKDSMALHKLGIKTEEEFQDYLVLSRRILKESRKELEDVKNKLLELLTQAKDTLQFVGKIHGKTEVDNLIPHAKSS
ncbi:hypothetical protein GW793_02780 [bacterium]|uniref:Peptidase M41 domain-containing protein n=2 Tax=Katanobacteria TaxID=422282 RepID=A0A2M7X1G8_UNCKA|nr:hypothetical protein [bacterium]PIP56481.1 MAG: hypothetical protein COX05_02825 [candidate division WWE3 bacterium CG22_combo_CG10-13_8_21_14_all_39_12]PJA40025.1 MAG: hypothetical protein CO179_03630 [candidate division WWE3 bacterium CG_4_9_14_3_um_filter_39_7]